MSNETTTETIARIYRGIVADSGTTGIKRTDALDELVRQIEPMWRAGDIRLDVADLIRNLGRRVDEADGQRADDALALIASGADDLSLDADPVLDLSVTLGRGLRKAWRNVTADDLLLMDVARSANVRSVSIAYQTKWRPQIDAWLPVLMRHSTIGAAVLAGDLPTGEALLFESA